MADKKRLTGEQLKAAIPFAEKEVSLPEFGGGTVLVRALSIHRQTTLGKGLDTDEHGNPKDVALLNARMFAASVVEPKTTVEEAMAYSKSGAWVNAWPRVLEAIKELSPSPDVIKDDAAHGFPDEDSE